jgi:hypothetical protein
VRSSPSYIRPAVHCSSPAFVTPCTHRLLYSPPCVARGVVRSSPSFATLCTHRIAFMHSPRSALISSSLSFATLCTHRFHLPRCALIASIRHAVRSSPSFAALCTHSLGVLGGILPPHILSRCLEHLCPLPQARLDGPCLLVLCLIARSNLLLIPTWVQVPSWAPSFWTNFWLFAFSPRATRHAAPAVHSSLIASIRHAVHS